MKESRDTRKIGGLKLKERENPEETFKNPYDVHHRYNPTDIRIRDYGYSTRNRIIEALTSFSTNI